MFRALIIDSDLNTHLALTPMLMKIGYERVHSSFHQAEALQFLNRNPRFDGDILYSWDPETDLQIFTSQVSHPRVNAANGVLLLIAQETGWGRVPAPHLRRPKTDQMISRPFGLRALAHALSRAHRARTSRRNKILYLSSNENPVLEGAVFDCSDHTHWKGLIRPNRPQDLRKTLLQEGHQIGSVLIHPSFPHLSAAQALHHFKMTPLGRLTPITLMSQDSADLMNWRNVIDESWKKSPSSHPEWEKTLSISSEQLLGSWRTRMIITGLRRSLRSPPDPEWIRRLIKALKATRYPSAQMLQAWGDIEKKYGDPEKARALYLRALEINPELHFAKMGIKTLQAPVSR